MYVTYDTLPSGGNKEINQSIQSVTFVNDEHDI